MAKRRKRTRGSKPALPAPRAGARKIQHAAGASVRPERSGHAGEPVQPAKIAKAPALGEAAFVREATPGRAVGDLATFFRSVGDGILVAQRELDESSAQYSREQPDHATAYRIPKVSAEISFAIEDVTDRGFNILLAKDETQLKNTQQQKVTFDVVAAPAPPELRAELTRRAALLADTMASGLVLAPGDRAEVLRRLDDPGLPPVVQPMAAEFKREVDRLVIFRAGDRTVVVRVVPGEPPTCDAISLAPPGPTAAESKYLNAMDEDDVRERDRLMAYLMAVLSDLTGGYLAPPTRPGERPHTAPV